MSTRARPHNAYTQLVQMGEKAIAEIQDVARNIGNASSLDKVERGAERVNVWKIVVADFKALRTLL